MDIGPCSPWTFCRFQGTGSGESIFLVGENNRALILSVGLVVSTSLICQVTALVEGVPFMTAGIASSSEPLAFGGVEKCWVPAEPGETISLIADATDGDTWSGIISGVLYGPYAA